MSKNQVRRFYFTALSNFAIGYDRYRRIYSKKNIKQSRFPERFFLLQESEIDIGIQMAQKLVQKLGITHDEVIALETKLLPHLLNENTTTGIGEYIESDSIDLEATHSISTEGSLVHMQIENTYAASMRTVRESFPDWHEATPRTISILPIARGCEATCSFCFSEGSISNEQSQKALSYERISAILKLAKDRGAERAVITGGGEPGLLGVENLCQLIRMASLHFKKIVLITNGFFLSKFGEEERREALRNLAAAGLTVLSVSRHHYNFDKHQEIMKLSAESELIANSLRVIGSNTKGLKLRLVCVLQKNGINTSEEANAYIEWAAAHGVEEVCFKELYVSSGLESVYYNQESNLFSAENQVPLRVIMDLADKQGWKHISNLPWDAPIFMAKSGQNLVQVAAYTEPSVMWELHNKICRSWNLMADGKCYASLEDRQSLLEI